MIRCSNSLNGSVAGCAVGGSSSLDKERRDNDGDDCFLDDVPVSVPAQDLPFSMFPAENAERIRLHIWYHLVGDCPQLDCLPCSRACE